MFAKSLRLALDESSEIRHPVGEIRDETARHDVACLEKHMRIIQLTDLHLTDPAGSDAARQHAEFIARGLRAVAERFGEAACCVITGDLTDQGEEAAYRVLHDQLRALPFPVLTLLGNHDDRAAYLRVFGGGDENGFVQSVFDQEALRLITLDTHLPGSDAGRLCDMRLDWLRARLAEAGETPVLLFLHHPPCDIGDPVLDPIRLNESQQFHRVVRDFPSVRHVFFGHIHRDLFINMPHLSLSSLDCPRQNAEGRGLPVRVIDLIDGDLRLSRVTL